jgi:PKD repeat protein
MKKRLFSLVALFLAGALLLASCSPSNAKKTTSVAQTTDGTQGGGSSSLQSTTSATTQEPSVLPTVDVEISEQELYDKLLGGWIGQMVGVTWSASTEFRWCGKIIPEGGMDVWKPAMINNGFGQDDIYVEIPFLDAMKENGALCDVSYMAEKFRDSQFPLWHANMWGRNNLRAGIPYPDSGHYLYNPCADDIDWQIECDFLGMMYPGLVNASALRSFDIGHIMNYGDGVYGGVYITAMHSAAYTAKSIDEIVEAGIAVIPENTKFRSLIEDVMASYKNGETWEECWQMLEDKWAYTDKCIGGAGNIDAKLNSAYVLMGLLWGEGDMAKTIIISCRCGQDSDCNPSSAASILGNFLGAEKIEEQYKSALDETRKYSNTNYTFYDAVKLNFDMMKEVLEESGATLEDGKWTIPVTKGYIPVPWEQWEDQFDVSVSVEHIENGVVSVKMTKFGEEQMVSFSLDMGDGFKVDFPIAKYAYKKAGVYTVKWSATGSDGTKVSHERMVTIKENVEIKGTPICSVTAPTGGGSKDVRVIFDGEIPPIGTENSGSQYDTYTGAKEAELAWAGVKFAKAYAISGVVFTEGRHFKDGGWFAEAPYIEILLGGEWKRIDAEISKQYPKNNQADQGASFESYTFAFGKNVECEGVRIAGMPGGSAYFISIGEISPICEKENDFKNDINIPVCSVTKPEGSGAKDISVIYDGMVGTDVKNQYDTYVKTPASDEAYVGYVYNSDTLVSKVVFTEGKHFENGGWFDGEVRVEVLIGGEWKKVDTVI